MKQIQIQQVKSRSEQEETTSVNQSENSEENQEEKNREPDDQSEVTEEEPHKRQKKGEDESQETPDEKITLEQATEEHPTEWFGVHSLFYVKCHRDNTDARKKARLLETKSVTFDFTGKI